MNERILEIAEQARKYARDYVAECKHYGHYMEHNEYELRFEEKFAELIVRECIGVIGEENYTMLTGKAYCTELKRHFGVEE